jgi:hypothetical protein
MEYIFQTGDENFGHLGYDAMQLSRWFASGLMEHAVSTDPVDVCHSHNSVATHCTVQCLCSNRNVTDPTCVASEGCTIVGQKDMEGRFGRIYQERLRKTRENL